MGFAGVWSAAILLVSVVAPIALAEGKPAYLILSAVAAALAIGNSMRRRPLVMSESFAQALALLAFGYLLFEYVVLESILVTALSHFLIVVCALRLLQAQSIRHETQTVLLCMLLLVVGAIVSADFLFAVALAVALALGTASLVRLYLFSEWSRFQNGAEGSEPTAGSPLGRPFRTVNAGIGLVGISVGALVFLACPRLESNLVRRFQAASAGPVLTGFHSSVELNSGQNIQVSERPIMRVRVTGAISLSPEEHEIGHYFRGQVSERYGIRSWGVHRNWGWIRSGGRNEPSAVIRLDADTDRVLLAYAQPHRDTWDYQFWLEPGDYSHLFNPAPILAVGSHDFSEFRLNPRHQTMRAQKNGKVLRYTVTTVPPYAASLVKYHQLDIPDDPPVVDPDPLPRQDEILRLVDGAVGDVGPLDTGVNREEFLSRLERFLSSRTFTYSLNTPPLAAEREPLGEFLLETRRGHCEYFASAMAVLCQLKGIPARLVTGYRGGEFNAVGGFLLVREKHAHAWVEAFVPGKGWLTYDPTPGESRPPTVARSWLGPARTLFDFLQFQWGNLVVSYNASARQELIDSFQAWLARPIRDEKGLVGSAVAFTRELFARRVDMSMADRLLYWVFAILVVSLFLLIGYVVFSILQRAIVLFSRWRAALVHRRTSRPEAEFYHRFCRRLETVGLRRRPDQTPAEFADELAAMHPAFEPAPELVRLYYLATFGMHELTAEHRSRVEQFLTRLQGLDPAALHGMRAAAPPG